jgi:hypothetical protein
MTITANQDTGAGPEDWRVAQERTGGPVHTWFSLSYANFLVWHRAHMQSMPVEWQQRFTDLAEELDAAYPDGTGVNYEVATVDSKYVSELTEDEMRQLDIGTSDDDDEDGDEECDGVSERKWQEREYYLKDGTAVPGVHRVGIPVPDPVPHYNRGRTYLAPDEDGIAACLASRQRRADLDES